MHSLLLTSWPTAHVYSIQFPFQNYTLETRQVRRNEDVEGTEKGWNISFSTNCHSLGSRSTTFSFAAGNSEIDLHNRSLAMLENQLAQNGQDQFIDLSYLDL